MVFDPVSAFGVAAGVVQFIQFSGSLLSKTYELYRDGENAFVEIRELEAIGQTLLELDRTIEVSIQGSQRKRPTSPEEEKLRLLCRDVRRVASQLLDALDSIKVRSRHAKWRSFREALGMIWKTDRIDEIARTLDRYRAELDTFLLVSLRNRLDDHEDVRRTLNSQLKSISITQDKMSEAILGHINHNMQWQADLIDAMHEQDWRFIKEDDNGRIKRDYEDKDKFSTHLTDAIESRRMNQLQRRILKRLQFASLRDRHYRISDAHRHTFQWIFETPIRNQSSGHFANWLKEGNGIFWVTGKPASGKSTLTKLIYDDERTRRLLRNWVNDASRPLIIAGYFFWKAGDSMQRTQAGLLQTLIHDVLRQRPSLISKAFPDRWESFCLFGDDFHSWTWIELRRAFSIITKDTADQLNIFFIIDGLDECEDDHEELVTLLEEAISLPHVKLCVGSRPEQTFKDAFDPGPNLQMQDLTFRDIVEYVDDKLCNDRRFSTLKRTEPQYAATLGRSIAEKSAGVFLWVTLVVRSLLEGLRNSDRVSDLQRRLERTPPELDDLYSDILRSLDPFYLDHASQLFQIIRTSQESLTLLDLSFADEEDTEFAMRTNIVALSDEDIVLRCESMDRRLNSRCKGLLEAPGNLMLQQPESRPEILPPPKEPISQDSQEGSRTSPTADGFPNHGPALNDSRIKAPDAEQEQRKQQAQARLRLLPQLHAEGDDALISSDEDSSHLPQMPSTGPEPSIPNEEECSNLNADDDPSSSEIQDDMVIDSCGPALPAEWQSAVQSDSSHASRQQVPYPLSEFVPRRPIVTPFWESKQPYLDNPDFWGYAGATCIDGGGAPHPSTYMAYYQRNGRQSSNNRSLQDEMFQTMFSCNAEAALLLRSAHSAAQLPRQVPEISYLHRTAKDFIERTENWQMLLSANLTPFNPDLALLRSSIINLKSLATDNLTLQKFWSAVKWCMNCARQAELRDTNPRLHLIDEIDRAALKLASSLDSNGTSLLSRSIQESQASTPSPNARTNRKKGNGNPKPPHWVTTQPGRGSKGSNFICLAVQYNLVRYVQAKHMQKTNITHDDMGRPMLDYVFSKALIAESSQRAQSGNQPDYPDVAMVKLLLRAGANPNEWSSNATPWQRALELVGDLSRTSVDDEMKVKDRDALMLAWCDIIRVFILAGADPKADYNSGSGSYVREIFESWDSEQAQKLERLIRKNKRKLPKWGRGGFG